MLDMSFKAIQKARQMAKRSRAAVACARCKAAKMRCSDFRPCKKCTISNAPCQATGAQAKSSIPDIVGLSARTILPQLEAGSHSGDLNDKDSASELNIVPINTRENGHQLEDPHPFVTYDSRVTVDAQGCTNVVPRFSISGVSGFLASHATVDLSHNRHFELPATRTGIFCAAPTVTPLQATIAPALLPQAVADLLCGLTRPVPHPPPPPNALNILLAMAMACAAPVQTTTTVPSDLHVYRL